MDPDVFISPEIGSELCQRYCGQHLSTTVSFSFVLWIISAGASDPIIAPCSVSLVALCQQKGIVSDSNNMM